MITFSVPIQDKEREFFVFNVEPTSLMLAGSRSLSIPKQVCSDLIKAFSKLGFGFTTGCASGVDESFRLALAESESREHSLAACAFKDRAERISGIHASLVVPEGLPPRAALAKRTLWLTSRCSMLVLFPSDPIGKGSALAFRSTIYNSRPVFLVTKTRPEATSLYRVYPSNLFGIVDGFWCVPHPYKDGLCYEVV